MTAILLRAKLYVDEPGRPELIAAHPKDMIGLEDARGAAVTELCFNELGS